MFVKSAKICFLLLVVFAFITKVNCKIPDYIKKCPKNGEQSNCLLENTKNVIQHLIDNNGDSALKIQDIKSIRVPKLEMQATKDLQIALLDLAIVSFDQVDVKEVSIKDNKLHIKAFVPRVGISGKYDMKGRILILPIEGQGTMNLTNNNFMLDYNAKLKTEERKGKNYYIVADNEEDTQTRFSDLKLGTFQFDNLFGGDPRLGPEMNKFLNDNWRDVYNEVEGALESGLAVTTINPIINAYLRHIPIDELFAD